MYRAVLLLAFLFVPMLLSANGSRVVEPAEKLSLSFERLLMDESMVDGIGPVLSIVQDAQGFMWFAGENGLVRYDAHTYTFYFEDNSSPKTIPGNFVSDLLVDLQGTLWVATSEGLSRYNQHTEDFTTFRQTSEGNADDTSAPLSSFITDLALDSANRLYVGTSKGLSVFNADRTKFQHYHSSRKDNKAVLGRYIRSLHVDKDNNLWVGGYGGDGLTMFNENTGAFRRWQNNKSDSNSLIKGHIDSIQVDQQGNTWLATTGGGLSRLHSDRENFTHYKYRKAKDPVLGDYEVRHIFIDDVGRVWIATDHGGLALYLPPSDSFIAYKHQVYDEHSISSNHVRYVYQDMHRNLWVGNFPTGINFYDISKSTFKTLKHDPNNLNSLAHNGVICLFEDSEKKLWIGTEGGLDHYDPETEKFTHYQHDPDDPFSLRFNAVVSVVEDNNGELWVGTWSGGLHRFDKKTQRFHNYYPDPEDPNSFSSPYAWTIELDSQGSIWIGATELGGLNRYRPETDDFEHYQNQGTVGVSATYDYIWDLLEDSHGMFWVGSLGGLEIFDRNKKIFKHFKPDKFDPGAISGNDIRVLYEDSKSNVWVGTDGNGVNIYQRETKTFKKLDRRDGLPSSSVTGIIEDKSGNIWLTTNSGLARLETSTGKVRSFYKSDGLAGNNHNRSALVIDESGILYVGSTAGVTVFKPEELKREEPQVDIQLTKFSILNKVPPIGVAGSPLVRSISRAKEISLSHKDTMFSFEYSLPNYRSSHKNEYAYKLEGFDEDWNYVGRQRKATYTNLDPGKYIFKVKGQTNTGVWSSNNATVEVTVKAAPWRTPAAYALYVCLTLLLGTIFVAVLRYKSKQRKELGLREYILIEKDEEQRTQIAEALKLRNCSVSTFDSGQQAIAAIDRLTGQARDGHDGSK